MPHSGDKRSVISSWKSFIIMPPASMPSSPIKCIGSGLEEILRPLLSDLIQRVLHFEVPNQISMGLQHDSVLLLHMIPCEAFQFTASQDQRMQS